MRERTRAEIQRYIDGIVAEYVDDLEYETEGGPRYQLARQIFGISFDTGFGQSRTQPYEERHAEPLFSEAENHWDIEQLYRDVIAIKLSADVPLYSFEKLFLTKVLTGTWEAKTKKKRGGSFEKNWNRNFFIVLLILELRDSFNVTPTRNDEKKNGSGDSLFSGQDIVSKAFKNAGRNEVTPKVVKNAWTNSDVRKWSQRYFKNEGRLEVFKPPST